MGGGGGAASSFGFNPLGPHFQTFVVFSGKKAATAEDGELHVLIKEAKDLLAMKSGEISDSFVKG